MFNSKLCPCCSKKAYAHCCLPIISGRLSAVTPEQLMRSRYSAYAIKNAPYIFNTYATNFQKHQSIDDIQAWADECTWMELNVTSDVSNDKNDDNNNVEHISSSATVSFSAFYLNANKYYKLSEKSRFIKEQRAGAMVWRYLDGEILEHTELRVISRNDVCPCFENQQMKKQKKFKRCCANK